MPRVRVAWITAPNTSINDPIANGLGASEEFVVGMFLPEEARTQPLDTRNYTPVYFHMHDWTRPVLGRETRHPLELGGVVTRAPCESHAMPRRRRLPC